MSNRYVLNPLTNRNVKVGGRIYNQLIKRNLISPYNKHSDDDSDDESNESFYNDSDYSSYDESDSESSVYEIRRKNTEYISECDDDVDIDALDDDEKEYILKVANKINR